MTRKTGTAGRQARTSQRQAPAVDAAPAFEPSALARWWRAKWLARGSIWIAFAIALIVVAVLMSAIAFQTAIETAGHFGGLLMLAVLAVGALLVIVVYGFDAWTQAREINRAVDRIDDALAADQEREITDAESRVYQAGGVQTAGLFVMVGLIVFGLLFHAAHMVVPNTGKAPTEQTAAAEPVRAEGD